MERVKNIESLSLMFTAGVVAGTVFFPGAGIWLPALLLPLASLPILAKERLLRMKESMDSIERSIKSYGSVQLAKLEKGCSWITLCIAIAPSLGFLGTVIGMVMAFDQIEFAGDISPKIVAGGMKVALITTIFGIIVALILQLFYNYILSKIDHLTAQMEESAISLMDILGKVKSKK